MKWLRLAPLEFFFPFGRCLCCGDKFGISYHSLFHICNWVCKEDEQDHSPCTLQLEASNKGTCSDRTDCPLQATRFRDLRERIIRKISQWVLQNKTLFINFRLGDSLESAAMCDMVKIWGGKIYYEYGHKQKYCQIWLLKGKRVIWRILVAFQRRIALESIRYLPLKLIWLMLRCLHLFHKSFWDFYFEIPFSNNLMRIYIDSKISVKEIWQYLSHFEFEKVPFAIHFNSKSLKHIAGKIDHN